jgi:thiosulfate reductase cytochrome b subunit
MMGSGLQIYNAMPVFGGKAGWPIPKLATLGDWLAGGRDIHFALIYTAMIPVLMLAIASELAMYKPAQLHWLSGLFINWQILRTIHFLTVPISLIFILIHLLMGIRVGRLRLTQSMFRC